MRVEIHENLKGAISIPASRVVVYDQFDNPIAVVIQIDDRQYVAATAAQEKTFKKILETMGINKTLVVDHLDSKKFKPLD